MSTSPDYYKLKIQLKNISPLIWRTFIISNETSLTDLHKIIKIIMGWTDNKSYRYIFHKIHYGRYCEDYLNNNHRSVEGVTLNQLLKNIGDTFTYEYDYNNRWEHLITLEEILAYDTSYEQPKFVVGARACPPEDCAGLSSYEEFIEVLNNPKHKLYNYTLFELGGEIDPEYYSPYYVNLELKYLDMDEDDFPF